MIPQVQIFQGTSHNEMANVINQWIERQLRKKNGFKLLWSEQTQSNGDGWSSGTIYLTISVWFETNGDQTNEA